MSLPSDPEVEKALKHPLRKRLVPIYLASQPLSPKEAARLVGEPLSSVAYHVNELVKFRFLVFHSSEAVRGTQKSYYILNDGIPNIRGVKELLVKRRRRD
jgi:predicted transcriptional regulator